MRSFKLLFSLLVVAVLLSATGCKKFLDERSQNLEYADTWQKLEEVLNGDGYEPHFTIIPYMDYLEQSKPVYFPYLNSMDDDITEFVKSPYYIDTRSDVFGFYTWQADPYVSSTYSSQTDDMWPKVYANISAVNTIVYQATTLSDDPAELKRIRGEALFLRAGYYFYLVNLYAPAYNKKTAATDPGVPLKITEYVEDRFFGRSTVDSVYRQMVGDLKEAETDLAGTTPSSLYHADINAVHLLQSRVYLYMQDWADAEAAADKVIAQKSALYDLAGYQPQTSFFSASSPEAIFTQGGNAMIYLMLESAPKSFQVSQELLDLYDSTDLRRSAFFELDPAGKYRYTKMYRSTVNNVLPSEIFSDNFFMRNAEAFLNKAEAAAMLGETQNANDAINTLRKARYRPADYVAINLTGNGVISFIRDERRRELCFEGHRWFDLKRYAVNEVLPFTKTITHSYSDVVYGSAPYLKAILTLPPGDPAYLIPIPAEAIVANQGVLLPNPVRPNRAF
ncbi:MAG TPA: RagB/SusD family nutrient uptake outer membrane protein [Puia sp.]|nr:RagB/SusD family nutrient uptake outer membrane protein [Puia sp.]